jgi:hypothetical protein
VVGITRADAALSASRQSAEEWVHELVLRQWTAVCMGPKEAPVAIAAFHRDNHWTDVVILRGPDRAAAYRVVSRPADDPLAATHIVWHYLAGAAQTLYAVLHLVPDTTAVRPYPIPHECQLPELAIRPLTIRLGASRRTEPQCTT